MDKNVRKDLCSNFWNITVSERKIDVAIWHEETKKTIKEIADSAKE
ncbi:MAG: hypothetical protein LUE14_01760 [Clostridiales bacterium]|nr:hypothetical protein [Clostridiales bacterium]